MTIRHVFWTDHALARLVERFADPDDRRRRINAIAMTMPKRRGQFLPTVIDDMCVVFERVSASHFDLRILTVYDSTMGAWPTDT